MFYTREQLKQGVRKMLSRFWVSKRTRYVNSNVESYYEVEVRVDDEATSTKIEFQLPDDARKEIMKILRPHIEGSVGKLLDKADENV